jgi:phage shock protein C
MMMTTRNELRRQNGVVAGVCGGLGAFFGVDPLWVRLGFLLALAPGGVPGLLIYLVMWFIMPKAPVDYTGQSPQR